MSPRTRIVALLGTAVCLSACQDYGARRETISLGAGDAVAANRAIHAVDPWPDASRNTAIPVSGRRMAAAVEAYEARGKDGDKKGGAQPVVLAPVSVEPPGAPAP